MNKSTSGFTIVELLIVIVVIGILASITVVAFNGIQNRGYDTSIKSDLSNYAKRFEVFRIDNSRYPADATTTELASGNVKLSVNKNAYDTSSSYNLSYCTVASESGFALLATSKSGKRLYITNTQGITEYTGAVTWTSGTLSTICQSVLASSAMRSSGYVASDPNNGGWRSWASN